MTLYDDELQIEAQNEENLRMFLDDCYEQLALRWWNVSTANQIAEPKAVYYNRNTDEFELKPKRMPTPIPSLFIKGSSWRYPEAIDYDDLSSEMQQRVDEFLEGKSAELSGKKRKLLLKAPVCHKELEFFPPKKKKKNTCAVCGAQSSNCVDVSQPTYLLFASNSAARSFNSQASTPDKVCWECEMLGRFAVESASYHQIIKDKKGEYDLFILHIYSPDLTKAAQINQKIGYGSLMREINREDYRSNIRYDGSLIKFARLPYEFLWAFFVQAYDIINENIIIESHSDVLALFEELMHLTMDKAPIEIILFMVSSKGQTFITKEIIYYNEPSYAFRLLYFLDEMEISAKSLFNQLRVRDEKDHHILFRNEFFRRILLRQSVVKQTESFAFHQSMGEQGVYLNDLLRFLMKYEPMIRGVKMTEQQIEAAVNLGKSIVLQARDNIQKTEEFKKIKGDLFSLRKTRNKEAFINQLITLQMRYGLIVSNVVQEGVLEKVPFEEFKAYCMLGALNTFNSITRPKKEEGKNE